VFYTHDGGRGGQEAARIADVHKDWVRDFSVCGGRMATASRDNTAAMWSVDSRERLAQLTVHTDTVSSVDMNDRLVVTASWKRMVQGYKYERG
jgi:WD40 repeat protein